MEMVFERGNNSNNRKKKNTTRVFVVRMFVGVQLIVASVLNALLMELDLLPKKYDILFIVAIVLINIITWFSSKKLNLSVLMSLTSLLVTTCLVAGTLSIYKIDSTIGSVISTKNYEIVQMAAVVPVNSDVQEVSGLSGKSVGIISSDEHIEKVKTDIKESIICA